MDYYEELGLDRTATEEEIRRAHRRLTKLLHPDQQTDEAVKQLADTQMRRLNAIVDTLCDPEKRREYDDELRRGPAALGAAQFRRRAFHSWPWWVASTVGAVVLTVGAVWFSADKWGSSFGDRTPTYIPSGAETNAEPNTASTQPAPATAAKIPAPSGPAPQDTPPSTVPEPRASPDTGSLNTPPSRTVASVPAPSPASKIPAENSKTPVEVVEVPHHKVLTLPLTHVSAAPAASIVNLPAAPAVSSPPSGHIEAVAIPSGNLPSAPKLPEPPAPANAGSATTIAKETLPATPRDALEGEWVYAPIEPEKRKAGFYPPEYIDLKIWNEGGLHGEYRARYHVSDKPIAPDVNFALAPDGNPRHFTWASSNGAKGTLKVSSMDAGSIRIEWRTTVFGPGLALTAGTATLVRRTP